MKACSSKNSLIKIMCKLDFLVTFRFQSVIFDGFVAVIEENTVSFCPTAAGIDFFLIELISSMFLEFAFDFSPPVR